MVTFNKSDCTLGEIFLEKISISHIFQLKILIIGGNSWEYVISAKSLETSEKQLEMNASVRNNHICDTYLKTDIMRFLTKYPHASKEDM